MLSSGSLGSGAGGGVTTVGCSKSGLNGVYAAVDTFFSTVIVGVTIDVCLGLVTVVLDWETLGCDEEEAGRAEVVLDTEVLLLLLEEVVADECVLGEAEVVLLLEVFSVVELFLVVEPFALAFFAL